MIPPTFEQYLLKCIENLPTHQLNVAREIDIFLNGVKPHLLILMPKGSGKTTLAFSLLCYLDAKSKSSLIYVSANNTLSETIRRRYLDRKDLFDTNNVSFISPGTETLKIADYMIVDDINKIRMDARKIQEWYVYSLSGRMRYTSKEIFFATIQDDNDIASKLLEFNDPHQWTILNVVNVGKKVKNNIITI